MKNILVMVILLSVVGLLLSGIFLGTGNIKDQIQIKGNNANTIITNLAP